MHPVINDQLKERAGIGKGDKVQENRRDMKNKHGQSGKDRTRM